MKTRAKKYWIIVASKDHVRTGIEQGVAQACHGKSSPLKRMQKDDFVIYYSGKQSFEKPEKCQKFTAIGRVKDEEVYPFQMTADFRPFRRNIEFYDSKEVSILPLIEALDFIPNKKNWGYTFRFGLLEVKKKDFELISSRMLGKQHV